MGPTQLEAAMADTGLMAGGPRRRWSGQAFPRKGRRRRRRALSGRPHPGDRAGLDVSLELWHPAQPIGMQRWLRASHPSQALPGPTQCPSPGGPPKGLQASRGPAGQRLQSALACRLPPQPQVGQASLPVLGLPDSVGTSGQKSFPALSRASLPLHHSPMTSWGLGLLVNKPPHMSPPPMHAAETTEAPVFLW